MDIKLYDCPNCSTEGVLPTSDFRCPNCKAPLPPEDAPNPHEDMPPQHKDVLLRDDRMAVIGFRSRHKYWLTTEVILLAVTLLASGLAVDMADYFSSDRYWDRRNEYGQILGGMNMGQCNA